MQAVREAMIVAGGAGTRLRPLTDTTPKPLLPFCGEPFLAGVLVRLADAGVRRVWLVVGADPSPFMVLRPLARAHGVELEAVPEPEPLDTAGGVRSAIERCDGSVFVLNGDVLTDVDLASVGRSHLETGADATLVLTRVEDTSTFGVCVLEGDRITGFIEKPPPGTLPDQDAINAGTYVLRPEALSRFPQGRLSFEREVFPGLVADGALVHGVVSDAVWADLGTPERYLEGHRLALAGSLRWPALAAVPEDGDRVRRQPDVEVAAGARVQGPALLATGSIVAAGGRVGPDVVLGLGCRIGTDATVTDSVLGAGTVVEAGATVHGVISGTGAVVGAEAALSGPVTIGDGVVVPAGSALGPGTRIPAP
ncbi:MAG: NDP-sugar synthase [Nitriliruptoraceae bacterium]